MSVATEHTYVGTNVPPPTAVDTPIDESLNGISKFTNGSDDGELSSKWPITKDLAGSVKPCRLEGEVGDLVVLETVPLELDGIFYRIMCDPFVPPHPGNVPIDGDDKLSAFRFEYGRGDFKM